MSSSYISDDVQDLIDRLNNVNSITGIESIIDMCHDAAYYIYETEGLKNKIRSGIEYSDECVKRFLDPAYVE